MFDRLLGAASLSLAFLGFGLAAGTQLAGQPAQINPVVVLKAVPAPETIHGGKACCENGCCDDCGCQCWRPHMKTVVIDKDGKAEVIDPNCGCKRPRPKPKPKPKEKAAPGPCGPSCPCGCDAGEPCGCGGAAGNVAGPPRPPQDDSRPYVLYLFERTAYPGSRVQRLALDDPAVRPELGRFTVQHVRNDDAAAKDHQVTHYPTLVVTDAAGVERGRRVGLVSAPALADWLKTFK